MRGFSVATQPTATLTAATSQSTREAQRAVADTARKPASNGAHSSQLAPAKLSELISQGSALPVAARSGIRLADQHRGLPAASWLSCERRCHLGTASPDKVRFNDEVEVLSLPRKERPRYEQGCYSTFARPGNF
jgi:hypothetical protein